MLLAVSLTWFIALVFPVNQESKPLIYKTKFTALVTLEAEDVASLPKPLRIYNNDLARNHHTCLRNNLWRRLGSLTKAGCVDWAIWRFYFNTCIYISAGSKYENWQPSPIEVLISCESSVCSMTSRIALRKDVAHFTDRQLGRPAWFKVHTLQYCVWHWITSRASYTQVSWSEYLM